MPIPARSGNFKTSYVADMDLFSTPFLRACVLLGLGAAFAFPFFASSYIVHIVNLILLAFIGALALNFVTGYAGLLSLGAGGFLCAGAFTTAILVVEIKASFGLTIVLAAIVGAVLGLIAGLPALRLKGIYLILSTLAIQYIIVYAAGYYQSRIRHFPGGITLPDVSIGPLVISSYTEWYFFIGVIAAIVTIFCINLERSRWVRAWIGIRERDIAAEALGVNVGLYKVLAFVFSSAIISVAGCLGAYYNHYATYEYYTIWLSVYYLAMIIIGGMASVVGSFLGAAIVTLLPYLIPWITGLFNPPARVELYVKHIEFAVFGAIMILILVLEPRGLIGIWKTHIRPYFELWPIKYRRTLAVRR